MFNYDAQSSTQKSNLDVNMTTIIPCICHGIGQADIDAAVEVLRLAFLYQDATIPASKRGFIQL